MFSEWSGPNSVSSQPSIAETMRDSRTTAFFGWVRSISALRAYSAVVRRQRYRLWPSQCSPSILRPHAAHHTLPRST